MPLNRLLTPWAAALAWMVAAPTPAAEMRTVEIGLMGGYTFADGSAGVDDDFLWGARAGYVFTPVHQIEATYDRLETTFRSVNLGRLDERFTSAGLDWVANFPRPRGRALPYSRLGLAWVEDRVTLPGGVRSRDTDLLLSFGGGVRVFTGDNFAFRFEGRFKPFRTFDISQFSFEITAGLTWTLGNRR